MLTALLREDESVGYRAAALGPIQGTEASPEEDDWENEGGAARSKPAVAPAEAEAR